MKRRNKPRIMMVRGEYWCLIIAPNGLRVRGYGRSPHEAYSRWYMSMLTSTITEAKDYLMEFGHKL